YPSSSSRSPRRSSSFADSPYPALTTTAAAATMTMTFRAAPAVCSRINTLLSTSAGLRGQDDFARAETGDDVVPRPRDPRDVEIGSAGRAFEVVATVVVDRRARVQEVRSVEAARRRTREVRHFIGIGRVGARPLRENGPERRQVRVERRA